MTVDRRTLDPFAPPPAPQPVQARPAPAALAHGLVHEHDDEFLGLAQMRKADLQALARRHDLDDTGNRDDLIDRLRDYRDSC